MSYTYFTADLHCGHSNIAKYCDRPYIKYGELDDDGNFVSTEVALRVADRMTEAIIRNMNQRINHDDTVIHVGDFCNRGNNKGVAGLKRHWQDYESLLNGKWIFIKGNHDKNNGMKNLLDTATMKLNGMNALIQHHPIYDIDKLSDDIDVVICGHVHTSWFMKEIEDSGIWNINVGLDLNKMLPYRLDEVIGCYHKHLNELENE